MSSRAKSQQIKVILGLRKTSFCSIFYVTLGVLLALSEKIILNWWFETFSYLACNQDNLFARKNPL